MFELLTSLTGKHEIGHSLNSFCKQHLCNHSFATVTRHGRSVKLWMTQHSEAASGVVVTEIKCLDHILFFSLQNQNTRAKVREMN